MYDIKIFTDEITNEWRLYVLLLGAGVGALIVRLRKSDAYMTPFCWAAGCWLTCEVLMVVAGFIMVSVAGEDALGSLQVMVWVRRCLPVLAAWIAALRVC